MKGYLIAILLAAGALVGCGADQPPAVPSLPAAAAPAAPQQSSTGDWMLPALGGFLAGKMLSGSTSAAPTVHHTTVVNKTVNVVRPPVPSTSPSSYRAPSYSSSRSSFSSSRSSFGRR